MSITILVLIRSIVAFIVLFIFTRLIGKQQLSQLTVFEYLVGITIGSMASAPFTYKLYGFYRIIDGINQQYRPSFSNAN